MTIDPNSIVIGAVLGICFVLGNQFLGNFLAERQHGKFPRFKQFKRRRSDFFSTLDS